MKKSVPITIMLTSVVLIAIAVALNPNPPNESVVSYVMPVPVKKTISFDFATTAPDLLEVYRANEVSADDKLKGKRLLVAGRVTTIAKDFKDDPYIHLQTGRFQDISCYISKEDARKLSIGQGIMVIGTCEGMIMRQVLMKDCIYIDTLVYTAANGRFVER